MLARAQPTTCDVAHARAHFAELINRARYGHERILITRRGQPVAVLAPPPASATRAQP